MNQAGLCIGIRDVSAKLITDSTLAREKGFGFNAGNIAQNPYNNGTIKDSDFNPESLFN